MTKASKRKMEYIANYEAENYDKVLIRLPRGTKDRIKATGTTVNGFIASATLQALNNSQPAQAPQPQPTTTTPPDNLLHVPLSPDMIHNMDGAIRCGYSSDRVQYTIRAINTQIQQDIATEKEKRRSCVRPAYDPYDPGDDPDDDDLPPAIPPEYIR